MCPRRIVVCGLKPIQVVGGLKSQLPLSVFIYGNLKDTHRVILPPGGILLTLTTLTLYKNLKTIDNVLLPISRRAKFVFGHEKETDSFSEKYR